MCFWPYSCTALSLRVPRVFDAVDHVRALWSAIHQQHKRGLSLFRAPLTAASFLGLRGVITQLLENGVALESRDGDYNQTPLSHAVQRGHVVVTK